MSSSRNRLGLVIGLVLVGAGVLFLLGELTGRIYFSQYWPLMIVLAGLGFFIAMFFGGEDVGALAIPGAIITAIGLILYVLNAYDIWVVTTYVWTLLIVATGLGLVINGAYSQRPDLRQSGKSTIQVGLVLFAILGLIFTLIFNFQGIQPGGYSFFGLLLALIGLFLLIYRSILLIQGRADWAERDLFWPVIMIGAGLMFFLYGYATLTLDQLTDLWKWWPLALILIGLDWLVGRRWPVVGAVLAVLLVAASLVLMFDPVLLTLLK